MSKKPSKSVAIGSTIEWVGLDPKKACAFIDCLKLFGYEIVKVRP